MRATDATAAVRAILVLLLLGFGLPARAAEPGETVQASIRLADKQMPLPRGDWLLAGRGVQVVPEESAGPFGVIRTAILLRLAGDRVTAGAEFNTNDVPVSGGWDEPAGCEGTNSEPHLVRYRSQLDFACIVIGETRLDAGGPPVWQDVAGYIAKKHLSMPETMLTASFTVGDRQDIVDARLHFDPAGFASPEQARQMLLAWAARFPHLDPFSPSPGQAEGVLDNWPERKEDDLAPRKKPKATLNQKCRGGKKGVKLLRLDLFSSRLVF